MKTSYLPTLKEPTHDEWYTPRNAVVPIAEFLDDRFKTVWCPFDTEESEFVKVLRERGKTVVATHIDVGGGDFFSIPVPECDVIVSNPPFTKKTEVLERLYQIGKPFAILLPGPTLQGVARFRTFRQGIEILAFDRRIHFRPKDGEPTKSVTFPSWYFCRGVLPEKLVLRELPKGG